jgi:hypothetical protein
VSALAEVVVWAERAVRLIPVIRQLWEAIEGKDEGAELAAQLELVRQIRHEQAWNELGKP